MEEYEDVGSNSLIAYDATDATTATMEGQVQETGSQSLLITRQFELEMEKNQLGNPGVLKAISGNAAKWKAKAETRHSAKERSTSLAALKMIARQGADEKSQLEEWKTELLNKLTSEIAQIHEAHNIAMEAQREEIENQREQFQFEIQVLGERIRELEMEKEGSAQGRTCRSRSVVGLAQGPTHRSESVQKTPEREISQSSKDQVINPGQTPPVKSTEQRSYATVAAAKPAQTPTQPWTKVSYKNRRIGTTPVAKSAQRGRRILFPRKSGGQLKSEADIMLALNEALQKAGVESKVRFSRVRYAPPGSISALLTEKANAAMLLPQQSNLLIRAAKTVDEAVVGVEVLEQWQRLKVHGMSLERYLGPGKMELLKREVESSTGIPLKTMPRWLIDEERLKEQQELNNQHGLAIVITVSSESEAKQLAASGL